MKLPTNFVADNIPGATKLALALGEFFTKAGVTEGRAMAAVGILFASKASSDAECAEIVRHLSMAVHSSHMMRRAK